MGLRALANTETTTVLYSRTSQTGSCQRHFLSSFNKQRAGGGVCVCVCVCVCVGGGGGGG